MAKIQTITKEASDGKVLELLPVGTRVRHKKHPELVGQIVAYEYCDDGTVTKKVSPLPYKVYWDNSDLAHDLIGWFAIYPCMSEIEPAS